MESARAILSVVAVLTLLLGAAWWIRRSAGLGAGGLLRISKAMRTMTVVERLPLTPQHSLVVVSLGAERLLVAVHPAGVSVIDRFKPDQIGPIRQEERGVL
jgi:flagellar biogenesis protein FliO